MSSSGSQSNSANLTRDAEPRVGTSAVPMWLMMAPVVLLFLGALYVDRTTGWFNAAVHPPYTSLKQIEMYQPSNKGDRTLIMGRLKFEAVCAACHGSDGEGKPNQAPPFVGSEWVLTENVNQLIRIPMHGLAGPITVKGEQWNLNMVGLGSALTDEEIAAVLSYIRNSWGNQAPFITPEQVSAVREVTKGRTAQWTVTELKSVQ